MDQKKDDDKKPALPIPTLKDSKNAPQLKIKGLAQGGLSLMERLKQFKKKDLAFILAGLGVLFLAPLAEHFMMAPEGDAGSLQGGFGGRGDGGGLFGKGGSPYEPGVNGLAPGGLAGGGSDVITPLNVRDPAALVMGPGATQQPPASSAPAPAAPSKSDSSDWKDALAQSAAKAAPAAAKAAALPVPKIPLSAGGLRGLSAASGGGGGSYSLPALNASGVPNKANVGSSPSPTGGGGIRGVGARGEGQGGNPNSLDQLKARAGQAANNFNQGGASAGLENAAKTQFGDGAGGGGAGEGGGASDKASGASGDKGSKNADGQSLAFLKAKQEQEKAIEFEWKKKEAGDLDLMWFKLRDKMAEEAIMTPFKAITGMVAKQIGKFGVGGGATLICYKYGSRPGDANFVQTTFNVSDVSQCNQVQTSNQDGSATGNTALFAVPTGTSGDLNTNTLYGDAGCTQAAWSCNNSNDAAKPQTPQGGGYLSGNSPAPFVADCQSVGGQDQTKIPANIQSYFANAVTSLKTAAVADIQAREGMGGGAAAGQCGAASLPEVTALPGGTVPQALTAAASGTNDRLQGVINTLAGTSSAGSVQKLVVDQMYTPMNASVTSGKASDLLKAQGTGASATTAISADAAAVAAIGAIPGEVSAIDAGKFQTAATKMSDDSATAAQAVGGDLVKVNAALVKIAGLVDPNNANATATKALAEANAAIGQVKANQGNNTWDASLTAWAGKLQTDIAAQQTAYTAQKKTFDAQNAVLGFVNGMDATKGIAAAAAGTDTLVQRTNDGIKAVGQFYKNDAQGGPAPSLPRGMSVTNWAPYSKLTADVNSTNLDTSKPWSETATAWSQDMKADKSGKVQNAVTATGGVAQSLNADAAATIQYLNAPTAAFAKPAAWSKMTGAPAATPTPAK